MRINKITVTGDLVEVERELYGEVRAIRRHVQNYEQLSETEKQKLWHEIAGVPIIEYLRPIEKSLVKRIANQLKKLKPKQKDHEPSSTVF